MDLLHLLTFGRLSGWGAGGAFSQIPCLAWRTKYATRIVVTSSSGRIKREGGRPIRRNSLRHWRDTADRVRPWTLASSDIRGGRPSPTTIRITSARRRIAGSVDTSSPSNRNSSIARSRKEARSSCSIRGSREARVISSSWDTCSAADLVIVERLPCLPTRLYVFSSSEREKSKWPSLILDLSWRLSAVKSVGSNSFLAISRRLSWAVSDLHQEAYCAGMLACLVNQGHIPTISLLINSLAGMICPRPQGRVERKEPKASDAVNDGFGVKVWGNRFDLLP